MSRTLDFNCDMGESFGAWKMGNDAAIMPFVSSINIACGYHAGDATTMRLTVAQALQHGVAVGAHPSLPDLQGFGRRTMALSPQEVYDVIVVQLGALQAVAATQGARLRHAKMHGALYNMAAKDAALAAAIVRAIRDFDPGIAMYAPSGSAMAAEAKTAGLRVVGEVFADRAYRADGSLAPRGTPGAMIDDVSASLRQVLRMVEDGVVDSIDGQPVAVTADTLCIHGDQPGALEFARTIRTALEARGIRIAAP